MGIIAFIVLGLIAGVIAKAIMPGNDPGGIIVTAIIGIVGALLGGFVAAALFDAHPLDEFFDISTWLTAILGAIVLLVPLSPRCRSRRARPPRAHLTTAAVRTPRVARSGRPFPPKATTSYLRLQRHDSLRTAEGLLGAAASGRRTRPSAGFSHGRKVNER